MIAIAILLLTFSTAANKAIADLGQVEIDDLFYSSGAPSINEEIEQFEFDQVDKILIKNEDLELESLEIADIDLATFGEYEAFLNKYYDDNYFEINSNSIKQIQLFIDSKIGQMFQFGENGKYVIDEGLSLSIARISPWRFNFLNLEHNLIYGIGYANFTTSKYFSDIELKSLIIGTKTNLSKRIKIINRFDLISLSHATQKSYGFNVKLDLSYEIFSFKNSMIEMYVRLQTGYASKNDFPVYGSGGTVENLGFGFNLSSPLYLTY